MIQVGRVDPVISYGTVANHVHKIAGASNIGVSSTYDTLQQSDCTSCTIQADKSAYWTPALYYQHADGTFEEVKNTGQAVYYLGRGSDPYGNTQATPFPKGLKMLSGNNAARTLDTTTMTWGNKTVSNRPVSDAVSFVCLNYQTGGSQTNNLTNMDCPDGFRAQIQMQTCWDGKNLYLSDQSHVAHLSRIDNGVCPPTHPVLLPHLFYEVFYSVSDFLGGDGQFVFANGDKTGYGFHGDFINGWDIPTLTTAIDQCLIKNENGVVEDCPAFSASNNPNSASACPERSPIFPCEPVKGKIDKLPGCITPTGYGHTVTSADISCPGGNVASCNATKTSQPVSWTGDAVYSPLGCYTEATSGRALTGNSYTADNMTAETCETFCSKDGFKYMGVEYGRECYCGHTLNTGSVATNSSDCDKVCGGNQWEICGGGSRLNMFQMNSTIYKAPAVPTVYAGDATFGYLGCYTEATSGRALSGKSYSDNKNMTAQACEAYCGSTYTYFGVEYGQECYCGNQLNAGSVVAKESDCSKLCTGDTLQYCGAGSRLNVFKRKGASASSSSGSSSTPSTTASSTSTRVSSSVKASSTSTSSIRPSSSSTSSAPSTLSTSRASSSSSSAASASATSSSGFSTKYAEPASIGNSTIGIWKHTGCYTELSSGRALAGMKVVGSSSTFPMTLEACAAFARQNNYALFGVEYGQECYVDNTLNSGSVLASSQDDCSTKCPGNSAEYCGAGKRLNIFSVVPNSYTAPSTPFSTKYPEPLRVGGGAGVGLWNYTGCYTEATTGRALADSKLYGTTAAPMTLETCAKYCMGKGSKMFGVEYSQECYCGSKLGAGSVWANNQNECSATCAGNSTQYCGAGGRLNIYSLLSSS